MLVRHAYFRGTVEPMRRDEFERCFDEILVPLIAAYPGLRSVRILRSFIGQEQSGPIYQVVETTYDDAEALEAALRSEERRRLYEQQEKIMHLFSGEVAHADFRVAFTSRPSAGASQAEE
jgi:uncharacterized protein (TIGR02118 family)